MASTPQSYELTPLVWVGLSIAGLAFVMDAMTEQNTAKMLATREDEKQIIIRSQDEIHQFPLLGVEVGLLSGWSYLAVREDPLAYRPAFVHTSSNSLVRLQADIFDVWPPEGAVAEPVIGKHATGELEWVRDQHVRVGRLQWPEHRLTIVAIQHDSKAELNATIEEFCAGIRSLDSRD